MLRLLVIGMLVLGVVYALPTATTEKPTCIDRHIWIADGSVDCHNLETPSFWGVHSKADYYCNKYSLTECCQTCTRMRQSGLFDKQTSG